MALGEPSVFGTVPMVPVKSNVHQLHPKPPEPWGGFFPSTVEERPPERKWLVKDLIPENEVVYLTGAPGAAKSKLLLQLQICAALGLQWIGRDVQQSRCLGLYLGEDDSDEQTRRCWEICDAYGVDISQLNDHLELNPRHLSDQWISTKLVDANLRWTSFGNELWQRIADHYRLIVIDTATKALGWMSKRDGDWVDRMVQLFRQKCVEHQCTVILTDHTNKSDRKGFAGVNALLAAVRAAMNIYIPGDNMTHEPLRNKRVLHEIRSSYSSWEPIHLKWCNGILTVDDNPDDETSREGAVTLIGQIGVETAKGIQFYDGKRTEWLPLARVEWNPEERTMTMPRWLARQKGFIEGGQ